MLTVTDCKLFVFKERLRWISEQCGAIYTIDSFDLCYFFSTVGFETVKGQKKY